MKKVFITLIILPLALQAEIYCVGGADASDTAAGTQQKPWATLKKAASKAVSGDTVIVAPGDYPEAVVVTASGTERAPITFRAEPSRQAKVQSFEIKGDYITIDGFEITNEKTDGFGVHCGEAHRKNARNGCHVLNNFIHDVDGRGIFSGEKALVRGNLLRNVGSGIFANSGTLVEDNEVDGLIVKMVEKDGKTSVRRTKYSFFAGDDITFRRNYFHGTPMDHMPAMGVCFFGSWDTWLYSASRRILIENNRCSNATHASEPMGQARKESSDITYRNNLFCNTVFVGIMPKGYTNVTIENNTFINCGAYPVWLQGKPQTESSVIRNNLFACWKYDPAPYGGKEADSGVRIDVQDGVTKNCDYNLFWNTPNRQYGKNDITAEPQFVDPDNGDFRLKPGSPGVDMGIQTDLTTDLLGTPRPQGKGCDIGAYETK